MKTYISIFFNLLVLAIYSPSFSQEKVSVTKEQEITLSLPANYTKSLGLYIFPARNQDSIQQKEDCKACYVWAYQQTGYDPANPTKVTLEGSGTEPQGAAIKGAARGALAGTAIGAVTGNAGDGAAVGAVTGAISGRRARRNAKKRQEMRNSQTISKAEEEMKTNFKNAFSACIKGKGYSIN
ncbi:glycine zipper family protein [Tenacibaculum sp. SG-28]|uniref:glycine zipper family protein n=1 Tax=Tenacibaculum sp. SG-28 TaxID=754426 RepID=UPI0011AFF2BC|nr:glycine zipper family protein [Tenacibaculum sp. SG-28]